MKTIVLTAGLAALTAWAAGGAEPLKAVPFTKVKLDGYWQPRIETNRASTIPYDFKKSEETGRIANFARAGGLEQGPFVGIPFNDSDVFKIVEGAAYSLAIHPDAELDRYLDALIAKFAAAQEPDGYLYTARRLFPPEKMPGMSGKERWSNLGASHELYNVGHMYEAAVAHHAATGKTNLMAIVRRNADLIASLWKPGGMGLPSGHEEIEIGLLRLYESTGENRYLDTAKYLMDIRGRPETHKLYGPYAQDHQPVVDQAEAVGHAVRACYLYTAMAHYAALTGDAAYRAACDKLWEDIVTRKMHVTGGHGARHAGEAFGDAYELPNATAYNETCAAIAGALFTHRMLLLHADAKYADVLERILYNGYLSGVALTGDRFFYPNPLEADGRTKFNHGGNERQPWFGCSCCPVNVVRIMPSLQGWFYATAADRLYVNLFDRGHADVEVAGAKVHVVQDTRYPWDGFIQICLVPERAARFDLMIRIPGWALNRPVPSDLYRYAGPPAPAPTLTVNGNAMDIQPLENGYAKVSKVWKKGDVVELNLPMPVRRVISHEAVKDNAGRMSIERGPIVYCLEGADHPDGRVLDISLPADAALVPEHFPALLGGVTALRGKGLSSRRTEGGGIATAPVDVTAIPYNVWCHRGPNEMTVWVPTSPETARPVPLPSLASKAKATASFCHDNDSLMSASDGVEPKNSNDHGIPRMTWWDHRGTKEWIQYEWPEPVKVAGVEIYWFDDTGRGQCRVPKAWRLSYRDGGAWKPVAAKGEFGVARDKFNAVKFDAVATTALRIDVDLDDKVSGGILEWRVNPAAP